MGWLGGGRRWIKEDGGACVWWGEGARYGGVRVSVCRSCRPRSRRPRVCPARAHSPPDPRALRPDPCTPLPHVRRTSNACTWLVVGRQSSGRGAPTAASRIEGARSLEGILRVGLCGAQPPRALAPRLPIKRAINTRACVLVGKEAGRRERWRRRRGARARMKHGTLMRGVLGSLHTASSPLIAGGSRGRRGGEDEARWWEARGSGGVGGGGARERREWCD